jgi:hypothetical protein
MWKDDALAATRGTQLGAILRCALGVEREAMPRFTSKAIITSDGFLQANFVGQDGRAHHSAFIGAASDLGANAKGLAKHLKLDEHDRAELYDVFEKWVVTDYSGKGIGI